LRERKNGEDSMMIALVITGIWVLGAIICDRIAKSRNVRWNFLFTAVAVVLGPLAIPLVFLLPSREIDSSREQTV
jgi:nitrate/nitrite transporter NarK